MEGLPSPTPSVNTQDTVSLQAQTKKRQRSASMHSATSSSSPKRSQSQGPIQEATSTQPATLPEYAEDVDVPMSISPPHATPDASSPPAYSGGSKSAPMWRDVSGEQKTRLAETMMSAAMNVGETWYLVAAPWFRRWQKAVNGTEDKEGLVEEKDLGPVDNSELLDESGELIAQLEEGTNVIYVPEQLWEMLRVWYGEPSNALPRKVRAVGARQEPTLEVRPPQIKPLLLVKSDDAAITGPNSCQLTLSADTSIRELTKQLIQAVSSEDVSTSCRVWSLVHPRTAVPGSHYPVSRLLEVGGQLLVDDGSKTLEEALIQSGDMLAVEFQEHGHWLVENSEVPAPTYSANTQGEVPAPLFVSETNFFDRMLAKSGGKPATGAMANKDIASGSFTRGSSFKPSASLKLTAGSLKTRTPGTLGLGNMGNTCFMNSALQCLSHTKELADYFLTGVYKVELNPDNPLGMQGAIAEAFGSLLHRIWANASATSYSPREFKQALQRFAPQFSGYQQHDSQELVAFLLDGLHEDLNRILKKPYVEKPDWEGGEEREMVELAKASWDGYLKRNDSVIVDLFQGQYRSTLVCPECQKVSITFDPFMYLTLPLPITKKWRHEVFYIPWDLEKPHLKISVEISADATFKDLRSLIGRWMDADPNNLATMEIFNNRFYKSLDDNVLCGDMGHRDVIVCYELPCHAQQSRTYKKQHDDSFILPVALTREGAAATRSTYTRSTVALFGYPFMIAINREQAKDATLIYEAIVDRLQRWTAHARDLYTWQVGSGDVVMEEVPIPTAPTESITEIQENGDIITIPPLPEEGDIVDEKSLLVEDDADMEDEDGVPQKLRAKGDIFTVKLQPNYSHGPSRSFNGYSAPSGPFKSLDSRQTADPADLLEEGDGIICEFDENMQAYFFGEHARWDAWEEFVHPELLESRKAAETTLKKGIVLQDCLDEFVKEEQLGEDDLWYCPRCKKHQQATKKFDLWKAPDVLVVHLKRFSNSRSLRDKIDTFVDFPIQGLDLETMIEERKVGKTLQAQGVDISDMGLDDLEDPLVYDLFAVDEHLGGLGGGHYRAYALNHVTEKWYHFDDSHVSEAKASDAVNANAYLLFYRRRSGHPLGGKTNEKIEEARLKPPSALEPEPVEKTLLPDQQLPTPPEEGPMGFLKKLGKRRVSDELDASPMDGLFGWAKSGRGGDISARQSTADSGSPPALDYPASTDDLRSEPGLFPLELTSHNFDFPDPSESRASLSPLSSADLPLGSTHGTGGQWSSRASPGSRQGRTLDDQFDEDASELPESDKQSPLPNSRSASRAESTAHPAATAPAVEEIPVEESTLLDIE